MIVRIVLLTPKIKKAYMKTIIILLIAACSVFPQYSYLKIRQITDIKGDARNPFVPQNPYMQGPMYLFFEIHNINASNIAFIKYYSNDNGKFPEPVKLTDDSFSNINPRFLQTQNYLDNNFLFFQTNKNGNWEIAYKILKDSVWSELKFVDSSTTDETNPSLMFIGPYYSNSDSARVLYQKGHSVCMATYKDNAFRIEEVFKGNDSVEYSQPTGTPYNVYSAPYEYNSYIDAAATKKYDGKSIIVLKTKNNNTGSWGEEKIIDDSSECSNPKFLDLNYSTCLSYEKLSGKYSNIELFPNWGSNIVTQSILDTVKGDLSDLHTWAAYIIVDFFKTVKRDYEVRNLYAYRYLKNDSMFIFTKKFYDPFYDFRIGDTLIYTKVKNTGLTAGYLTADSGTVNVVYEDSLNGHIQLFGIGAPRILSVKKN